MPISSRHIRAFLLVFLSVANGAVSASELVIVSREAWGANPPSRAMQEHHPTRITIHHTATKRKFDKSLEKKLKSLQSFSQQDSRLADGRIKKAWADLPYHYYIDANGVIAEGRAVGFVGDTNTRYDPSGHIGIAVEGNFETEEPSPAQLAALENLIVFLGKQFRINARAVATHRDFASTACPGRNLTKYMPQLIEHVSDRLSAN